MQGGVCGACGGGGERGAPKTGRGGGGSDLPLKHKNTSPGSPTKRHLGKWILSLASHVGGNLGGKPSWILAPLHRRQVKKNHLGSKFSPNLLPSAGDWVGRFGVLEIAAF